MHKVLRHHRTGKLDGLRWFREAPRRPARPNTPPGASRSRYATACVVEGEAAVGRDHGALGAFDTPLRW